MNFNIKFYIDIYIITPPNIDNMTDILKKSIDFYKIVNYNDIDYPIYKVKNKKNIVYFNNKDIFYSSPTGSYIILNEDNNDIVSLIDIHKFMFLTHNLY